MAAFARYRLSQGEATKANKPVKYLLSCFLQEKFADCRCRAQDRGVGWRYSLTGVVSRYLVQKRSRRSLAERPGGAQRVGSPETSSGV